MSLVIQWSFFQCHEYDFHGTKEEGRSREEECEIFPFPGETEEKGRAGTAGQSPWQSVLIPGGRELAKHHPR